MVPRTPALSTKARPFVVENPASYSPVRAGLSLFRVEPLPVYDTRPTNPLWGPLSAWLQGANPFDPQDRPETMAQVAEVLGVTATRLHTIRSSKGFRSFHTAATNNFGEIMLRRADVLDALYERAMEGSTAAAGTYLTHTKNAAAMAAAGEMDPAGLSPEDAADLSDEDLAKFLESQQ